MARAVTADDAGHLRVEGWVRIPGAIDEAELAALDAECNAQLALGPDRDPSQDFQWGFDLGGEPRWIQVRDVGAKRWVNDSVLLVIVHPTLLAVVESALGPRYVSHGDQLSFKHMESGGEFPLHGADANHHPDDPPLVTVAILLDKTGADGLRVAPRSHLLPVVDQAALIGLPIDDAALLSLVGDRGDLLVWNERIVHGSPASPPRPRTRRRMVQLTYSEPDYLLSVVPTPMAVDRADIPEDAEYYTPRPISRGHLAARMRRMREALDYRLTADWIPDEDRKAQWTVPTGWEDDVAAVTDDELAALCGG